MAIFWGGGKRICTLLRTVIFKVAMKIQAKQLLFFKNISIKPPFLKNWRNVQHDIFLISTKVNQQVKQPRFLQKKKIQNWNIFQIIVGFKILVFYCCNENSGKATFVFQKHINQATFPQKLKEMNSTHIFLISTKVNQHMKQLCFLQKKNPKLEHFSDNCELKKSCFLPLQ